MKKIIAMLAMTFVFFASPATAELLYWNVDIKGIIDSSTSAFSPDPVNNPDGVPYTLTCSANCGTFEVQSVVNNESGIIFGFQIAYINGIDLPLGQDIINNSGFGCEVPYCPIGYSGSFSVSDINGTDGSSSIYGPYPGSGDIFGQYYIYPASPFYSPGVFEYNAVYTTTSVSLVTNAAVAEPSTWTLILLGFAGLGFASYRHGRRAIL